MVEQMAAIDGADALVRSATFADIRAIAEFQTAAWGEAYRGIVPLAYLDSVTVDDREVRWRERFVTGDRQIALAEADDAVVGVVSWRESASAGLPDRELTSLYVAAGHRGRGVAGALLGVAIGAEPAHLWVFEDNPRAHAFYAKHGFAFEGERGIDEGTGLWEHRLVRR